MKRVTREWVDKAEADCAAALREIKARAHDLTCFLAQQAVEKYLKAILEERGVPFPKTHDLRHLANLATPLERSVGPLAARLTRLSAYAVQFRYPGAWATPRQARSAVAIMKVACSRLRRVLGLR